MNPRVCAIVCTYNGGSKVSEVVDAVALQSRVVDLLLLINNGSSDRGLTAHVCKGLAREHKFVEFLELPSNDGPAAAFATGIARSLERNYDFLWLLDDDTIASPDCLEFLIEACGPLDVVWPKQFDEFGHVTRYHTWRGPLFSRQVPLCYGLPSDLYIWGCEDTEYFQWRLPRNGISLVWDAKACVSYTSENKARKRASWHYYYLTRNTIFFRFWEQGDFHPLRRRVRLGLLPVLKLFGQAILSRDRVGLKLGRIAYGALHGAQGRLGVTFRPGDPDPIHKSRAHFLFRKGGNSDENDGSETVGGVPAP